MFLPSVVNRNPELVKAAVLLNQEGLIPSNTILLDADTIERNVKFLRQEADRCGLQLYFMLKQIRNPQIFQFILTNSHKKETVCVDTKDAKVIWESGNGIGNVGHLVQTPDKEIREILLMQPEVVTVFSAEKARRFSEEAGKLGMVQDILLRVTGKEDVHFPSMEGGVPEEDLAEVARQIQQYQHVRIVGVTDFPAMLYSNTEVPETTPNLETTLRCAKKLKKLGFPIVQINAPGNTCTLSMKAYTEAGATHVEPGHGITGTTPFSLTHDLPEVPAMLYVTEVLHFAKGLAYLHGGGFYWEDRMILGEQFRNRVLVGRDETSIFDGEALFVGCAPGDQKILIDYYGVLEPGTKKMIQIGDTAIFAFRTQAFATRCANTAVVKGIQNGNPAVLGVFDHCCHRLQRWP